VINPDPLTPGKHRIDAQHSQAKTSSGILNEIEDGKHADKEPKDDKRVIANIPALLQDPTNLTEAIQALRA
jgi:hypothetical protein